MANFKVVYRADAEGKGDNHLVSWERGCPLLPDVIQVSRETETGAAFLQVRLRSISSEEIRSFKAVLKCVYHDETVEQVQLEPLDADISPCGMYTPKPVLLSNGDVSYADVIVTHVLLEKNRWSKSGEAEPLPRRKLLKLSNKAYKERKKQLAEQGCSCSDSAVSYACVDYGEWLQCSCGKISMGLDVCPHCGLVFGDVGDIEDSEKLEAAADERELRMEVAKKKNDEHNAQLKMRIKKVSLIVAPIVVLLCSLFCWFSISHSAEIEKITEDPYFAIPNKVASSELKEYLAYLDKPFSQSGLRKSDAWNSMGNSFRLGEVEFLGSKTNVNIWYESDDGILGDPSSIEIGWPSDYTLESLEEELSDSLGSRASDKSKYGFDMYIPNVGLELHAYSFDDISIVRSSTQAKPKYETCEICSKSGSYTVVGASGYYCAYHCAEKMLDEGLI